MKTFSKIFVIAIVGIAALFAYSCQHINMDDIHVSPTDVNSKVVVIDADAGKLGHESVTVRVTTGDSTTVPYEWSVTSVADWIKIDDDSTRGKGSDSFEMFIDGPWYGTEARTGVVLITSKLGEIPVVVTQAPYNYTFEDYLGSYTVTSDLFPLGSELYYDGPLPYTEVVEMIDYRDFMDDLMTIEYVMTYDYGGYGMDFFYDEATSGLIFAPMNYGFYTNLFAYLDNNTFSFLDEGEVWGTLTESGEIVMNKKVEVDGKKYDAYFLSFSEVFGFLYSYDAMYNIKLVKNADEPAAVTRAATLNTSKTVEINLPESVRKDIGGRR